MVVNFAEKLSLFSEHWSPKIVAQMNDYHFKVVKVQGKFVWHSHPETDEVFVVLAGELCIEMREGDDIWLRPGEMTVIPKDAEHRPVAREECHILLVEPAGTINTGDTGSDLTVPNDNWL